ncbi:hypothetical protein AQUCO_00100506v1 [Aquilegia coerulea]|nr:hypothetical protein AQUCO_00100506v1 [Aquilegia coerulea]
MAKSQQDHYYSPLPQHQQHDQNQNLEQQSEQPQYYIVLPYYRRNRFSRNLKSNCLCYFSLLVCFLLLALFFLWPSDPKLHIVRIQLNHVRPHLSPSPSLDISMDIVIKVRNRDFFSFNYDSLVVSIGYRGRKLGFVNSNNGVLKARASSYVNATLVLDGIQVIHDVFYLIEDLAKGEIPFDTVTEVNGTLRLFFFDIPIKGKVSCEVNVNTDNQTIIRQDCYPE